MYTRLPYTIECSACGWKYKNHFFRRVTEKRMEHMKTCDGYNIKIMHPYSELGLASRTVSTYKSDKIKCPKCGRVYIMGFDEADAEWIEDNGYCLACDKLSRTEYDD